MIAQYQFRKKLSDGLVSLSSPEFGVQLFTRGKIRKARRCAVCKLGLKTGSLAYLPITNGYNRAHRVCVACMTEIVDERTG